MDAKISMRVICVEAIIYLLLHNLHDSTFKSRFIQLALIPEQGLISKLQPNRIVGSKCIKMKRSNETQ